MIVYSGKFFITEIVQFLTTFANSQRYKLILTKNGLSYIWGEFLQTHLVTLLVAIRVHLIMFCEDQGDQIGRIFAYWEIALLWAAFVGVHT
jgi:hypothetical protein